MTRILKFAAAAAACFAFASAAQAQDQRQRAATFAESVAVAASEESYARWSNGLCPSVAGLPAADAQTLIDHIARRAHQVNLTVAGAGCARNLIIIFAPDGGAVARELVETRRDLLGLQTGEVLSTAGQAGLDAFVGQDRPVRFWHLAYRVGADGSRIDDTDTRIGRGTRDAAAGSRGGGRVDDVMSGQGLSGVEAVRADGTRFRSATRQDIGFAVLVVDSRLVQGVSPSAVADYITMASLVQLNPSADLSSYPSILNLFHPPSGGAAAPAALTAWDMGYLQGLYSGRRSAASPNQQRADITRRIERAVESE